MSIASTLATALSSCPLDKDLMERGGRILYHCLLRKHYDEVIRSGAIQLVLSAADAFAHDPTSDFSSVVAALLYEVPQSRLSPSDASRVRLTLARLCI